MAVDAMAGWVGFSVNWISSNERILRIWGIFAIDIMIFFDGIIIIYYFLRRNKIWGASDLIPIKDIEYFSDTHQVHPLSDRCGPYGH